MTSKKLLTVALAAIMTTLANPPLAEAGNLLKQIRRTVREAVEAVRPNEAVDPKRWAVAPDGRVIYLSSGIAGPCGCTVTTQQCGARYAKSGYRLVTESEARALLRDTLEELDDSHLSGSASSRTRLFMELLKELHSSDLVAQVLSNFFGGAAAGTGAGGGAGSGSDLWDPAEFRGGPGLLAH